jgi:hypothetical protein
MKGPPTACLHPSVEQAITEWIAQRQYPAILLLGPPGIGKTTLAHRVFSASGLRTIEFNASHTRSGTSFRKTILPLLREGGIIQHIETGSKGGIGVLLDEIDGLSNGERGGLNELHAYLKSPEAATGRPLILISNTLDSRTLQQIAKLCLTFTIQPPTREILTTWLGCPPPLTYNGDLRSLQRQLAGIETPSETVEIPEGVKPIAAWTLWGDWDPLLEFDIENNEGNLASLMVLENIPERIEAALGNTEAAWAAYVDMVQAYKASDQGDFWAFFYQCWNILPISLRLKLKTISLRLAQEAPFPEGATILQADDLRYTPVLTKQSAMFNAWKLLCEIAEVKNLPVRLAAIAADLDLRDGGLRPDKVKRYQAISLHHLFEGLASSNA